ncbi:hypothetical protein V1477_006009 [Vespula maculifrons]|uniref:Uncharacterized protein n=1 Tax=Vespula maculifrons TaxID=7453 RepID=A0ABD2CKJ1_VESMC
MDRTYNKRSDSSNSSIDDDDDDDDDDDIVGGTSLSTILCKLNDDENTTKFESSRFLEDRYNFQIDINK